MTAPDKQVESDCVSSPCREISVNEFLAMKAKELREKAALFERLSDKLNVTNLPKEEYSLLKRLIIYGERS